MKKKWIQFIAVALLGLGLTACNSGNNEAVPVLENSSTVAATAATEPTPEQSANTETSSPLPNETPVADPIVSEPLPKQYRMNDAYRLIPLSEEIPSKAVLLTFDDGPKDEAVIKSMLDTLDKYEAKAIFFVNGYRVKQNPELLKLIHERGQTIGNHSWDHINLKNESEEVIEQQLSDLQSEINTLISIKPQFFRPPYGAGSDTVRKIAKNHGMLYMTWSNGSLDWDQSARDKPEVVIKNVMDQLHSGANILMHELQWTADALDELLMKLKEKGYSFIDPATIEVNG